MCLKVYNSHNYHVYHINGKIAADFIIRYEHLDKDIEKLEKKLDCPGLLKTFQKIRAKEGYRPKIGAPSRKIFSKYPIAKSKLDAICYENAGEYEFLREYWPDYKAKLEAAIKNNVSGLHYLFLKFLWSPPVCLYFYINGYLMRILYKMYCTLPPKIRIFLKPWLIT